MSVLSEQHKAVVDGAGKCSVPMWRNGLPAGLCDEPAYGRQDEGQQRYGDWGAGYIGDRWFPGGVWTPGFCSGLACERHGGPKHSP